MADQSKRETPSAKAAAQGAAASRSMDPAKGGAAPFPGTFTNPAGPGSMPFQTAPGFAMPPFGAPMPGAMPPQMPMPPMPGFGPMPSPSAGGDLFGSLGTMLRLGIDILNTTLASGNQLLQGLSPGGYPAPYSWPHPQDWGHHVHMHPCCGQHHHGHHHHDTYHDGWGRSCCDCCGESCCNPGVHNC